MRNNHRQLMGDTTRVRQIGNYETGHVSERLDRSSQISVVGFLEVKQDGQEVTLAQLLAYSIEYRFALLCAAPRPKPAAAQAPLLRRISYSRSSVVAINPNNIMAWGLKTDCHYYSHKPSKVLKWQSSI
jgi:hypothetical protein